MPPAADDDPRSRRSAVHVAVDASDAVGLREALREPGRWLRQGKLVAFPTETVYGLGANALDAEAVARVFAAKDRPSFNPLIVHVDAFEGVNKVVSEIPEAARRLAEEFWPGPLTMVLPRRSLVPDVVTGGLDTVGVRVPAHPVARALIAAAGVPLAAPSANPYTRVSPTTADHVLEMLGDRIDAVIDGGATTVGIESTVVAIEPASGDSSRVVLLRDGGVSRARLEQSGFCVVEPLAGEDAGAARRSPGRMARHYAPGVPMVAVGRGADGRLQLPAADGSFAVLSRGDAAGADAATLLKVLPEAPDGFARDLYAALHEVASSGCAVVFVEQLPAEPGWRAVADRLRRAGLGR